MNRLSLCCMVTASALGCPLLAVAGDAARGAELFVIRCSACHSVSALPEEKVGPSLAGIIGRSSGALAGYEYSDAMKASGIIWSDETLSVFLVNPRRAVPGTKMNFNGLKRSGELEDILAYLQDAKEP